MRRAALLVILAMAALGGSLPLLTAWDGAGAVKVRDELYQLTSGDDFDTHPTFSADGERVIFCRGGEFWSVATDGSDAHKIAHAWKGIVQGGVSPAPSPNGLLFTFVNRGTIYLTDAALRKEPEPLTDPNATALDPAWTPASNAIVYASKEAGKADQDLWITDLSGSVRPLLESEGNDYAPCVSPDGVWVYFTREVPGGRSDIWRVKLDGTSEERITRYNYEQGFPAIRPDGVVAYQSGEAGRGGLDIWTMSPLGEDHLPATDLEGDETRPRFSPDGSKIVFAHGGNVWIAADEDGDGLFGGMVRPKTEPDDAGTDRSVGSAPSWVLLALLGGLGLGAVLFLYWRNRN